MILRVISIRGRSMAWNLDAQNMQRCKLRQIGGGNKLACKVLYIKVSSYEKCVQTTHAFSFKPLANASKMSLFPRVGLPDKN